MKIKYEAMLEDVAEPRRRIYFRSKTYRRNRWITGVRSFFIAACATLLMLRSKLVGDHWPFIFGAGLVGAVVQVLTFKRTVTRGIKKSIKIELKDKLPSTVEFAVGEGRAHCEHLGAILSFSLS